MSVFGMMMTSIATEYWQIMLAQGISVGLGSGCMFVPSVAIIAQYFSTNKALATGIAATGSSFGELMMISDIPLIPGLIFEQAESFIRSCSDNYTRKSASVGRPAY